MLIKAGPYRNATWPGASTVTVSAWYGADGGAPRVDERARMVGGSGLRLRDLCVLRGVSVLTTEPSQPRTQGRGVSADVAEADLEGAKQPSTPATAHVNPIFMGDPGPYPWRRPV